MESKNKELYLYSKDVLNEEFQRFKKIDEKATRYLSILTALIGLFALLGRLTFAELIPPHNIIHGVTLLFGACVLLSLLYTWHLLFKVIKLDEIKKPPLSNEIFKYFNANNESDVLYGLAWNNKRAFEENRKVSNKKAKMLASAYRFIALTVILFLLFIFSSGVNEWNKDTNFLSKIGNHTQEQKNAR